MGLTEIEEDETQQFDAALLECAGRVASTVACAEADVVRAAVAILLRRRSWGENTVRVVSGPDSAGSGGVDVQIDDSATFLDVVKIVRGAVPYGEPNVSLSAGGALVSVRRSSTGEVCTGIVSTAAGLPSLSSAGIVAVLDAALTRPTATIGELATLSPSDEAGAASLINSSCEPLPRLLPVQAAFEEIAQTRPELVAIESSEAVVSYGEVDARANRLAHALRAQGIDREGLVGICLPRSIDLVVAVIATLKAGGAFAPLDPRAPAERTTTLARAADLSAIIAPADLVDLLAPAGVPLLIPNADGGAEPIASPVSLDDLAYVYFTSGSTGVPKGVAIDHRCAAGRIEMLADRYRLAPGDRVIHKTPLIFDVAIWEIFGPLGAGATIVLADDGAEADVEHIGSLLARPRVRFCHFVPSMLNAFLAFAEAKEYVDLEWVQLSGEAVPEALYARFREHFGCDLHNMYGQTETAEVAVWDAGSEVSDEKRAWVPIGRQVGLYRVFVVDDAFHLVPPGTPGELCIAGIGGLARGYLGQPGLTADSFVPNPWPIEPGERLYRTGDVAVADARGTLTYLGRLDTRTKIRGCRVEPGEVEAALLRHRGVRECAVVARRGPDGDELVAFVTGGVDVIELATHIEGLLPSYMLPSVYLNVDSLPRTPSGKLDRMRLPEPTTADRQARSSGDVPADVLEESLAAIWAEVLGVEQIGPTDNFFALGGNSLGSLRLVKRLKGEFLVDYSAREFFNGPTVREIAARIAAKRSVRDDEPAADLPHKLHPFEQAVDPEIVPLLMVLPTLSFDDLEAVRCDEARIHREVRAAHGTMDDLAVSDADLAGVPVRWYTPTGLAGPSASIIWLHGGGFVFGELDQNDLWCQRWASTYRCRVIAVDYRLAPESPYPAAIEDCAEVLQAVMDLPETDPARLVLAGISAGGALAAGTALWARDQGRRLPSALLLASPMLDDREADSETPASTYEKTWNPGMKRTAWQSYLGADAQGSDVPIYAAPGRATVAELHGLPPTSIDVGALDIFRNESIEFARRLMAAGVRCDLIVVGGAFHASEALAPTADASARIHAARASAFERALGRSSAG